VVRLLRLLLVVKVLHHILVPLVRVAVTVVVVVDIQLVEHLVRGMAAAVEHITTVVVAAATLVAAAAQETEYLVAVGLVVQELLQVRIQPAIQGFANYQGHSAKRPRLLHPPQKNSFPISI
jgi:hypothetical protein